MTNATLTGARRDGAHDFDSRPGAGPSGISG